MIYWLTCQKMKRYKMWLQKETLTQNCNGSINNSSMKSKKKKKKKKKKKIMMMMMMKTVLRGRNDNALH